MKQYVAIMKKYEGNMGKYEGICSPIHEPWDFKILGCLSGSLTSSEGGGESQFPGLGVPQQFKNGGGCVTARHHIHSFPSGKQEVEVCPPPISQN